MKQHLEHLLSQALGALVEQGIVPGDLTPNIIVENARNPEHGDFATNLAMILAKPARRNPRELAQLLLDHLPASDKVREVNIAGPGFINFFVTQSSLSTIVKQVLAAAQQFGCADIGKGQRVHMEYVSANPTGPLHVGHGRGAAYGACVANLLKAVGFEVHRDYYVNDAGRQMRILGLSVWLRYLQCHDIAIDFPGNAYQGDYIVDIAKQLQQQYSERFCKKATDIAALISTDLDPDKEKEAYIDQYIEAANTLLGESDFDIVREAALESILADIKEDLAEFGVVYEDWFRESELFSQGLLDQGLKLLASHDYLYKKDGATWFKATKFGDEKDRVLIRANGQPTYFASDVAYHLYKYNAGYDRIIDVFGADHHGYIGRIRAFLQGVGKDPDKLCVLLVQFAILYRGDKKVAMSTRSGSFVTLRELRAEVGNDAARFFYIMRKPEQHLDFDLKLAASQSNDNPVYYIQYAHARICSVWRQLADSGETWQQEQGLQQLALLDSEHEKNVLTVLARYPEVILNSAERYEPHSVANYLQTLAAGFHAYYNHSKFLVDDANVRNARLCLIAAVKQVLLNGLTLLGLTAPEKM